MITTTTSTAGSPTTSATSRYEGHPRAAGRELLAPLRRMGAHRPELREASRDESIELSEVGAEHVAGPQKTDDGALSFHDAERLQ